MCENEKCLKEPDIRFAEEIRSYRQEFLDAGDHMDGCGPLRKFEDPLEYIENCRLRANAETAREAGGYAQQFLCVRETDERVVGMIQYRYEADPKFQIGYSVRPSERGKGYAKQMLAQLMIWLGRQGKTEATIACEPSNKASERIILSCGGEQTETCEYKGIELKVFRLRL